MSIKKNDVYTAEISSLTNEGLGICKIEGFVVFVPMTAPGDICEIKIVKVLSHHGYGIVQKLLTPSAERIDPQCAVYQQCGGCSFRHINYKAELAVKQSYVEDCFKRIGGINIPCENIVPAPEQIGYRNKCQIPVGADETNHNRMKYGFFAGRSHRIVPCSDCALQPGVFFEIAGNVTALFEKAGLKAYDEVTGKGDIRHVYLRHGEISGEIMLCIIVSRDIRKQLAELVPAILSKFPAITTVVMNFNSKKDNVILGDRFVSLSGTGKIKDILCGLVFELSPASFYQVNRRQTETLYQIAQDYAGLTGSETVLDLFCGVGTIGLSMAKKAKKMIGVEIVPEAIENAKSNAARNGINNAEFVCADAKEAVRLFESRGLSPDVVILDPPRKGCDADVIESVSRMKPERIVMISCNPATGARDCKLFEEHGYRVKKYCPVDMFPRTKHVETVALMSRVKD